MLSIRPRVLIADDHWLIAELCKKLLEKEFDVVGIVGDGRAMVRAASQLKPDVIIVDVGMPILNGLDAGQQVMETLPAVKIIFLTMHCSIELAAEAFRRLIRVPALHIVTVKLGPVRRRRLRLSERKSGCRHHHQTQRRNRNYCAYDFR